MLETNSGTHTMKPLLQTAFAALLLATTAMAGFADEEYKRGNEATATKESHHAHDGAHGHSDSAAGRPGNPRKISRTIKINALDIKYDKPEIQVMTGETIKFVVTNTGKLRHEFIIGDTEEQRQHAEMMKQMPDMVHEDANTLTLEPGETKSLVWQFTRDRQTGSRMPSRGITKPA
jgi:uncharacterized cupredoxin-like copper-binding protein